MDANQEIRLPRQDPIWDDDQYFDGDTQVDLTRWRVPLPAINNEVAASEIVSYYRDGKVPARFYAHQRIPGLPLRTNTKDPDWIPADKARGQVYQEMADHYVIPFDLVEAWCTAWADSPEHEDMGLIEWAVRTALMNEETE